MSSADEIQQSLTKQKDESYDLLSDNLHPLDFQHRAQQFEIAKQTYLERISAEKGQPINITLPDGTVKEGNKFETRPIDIANGISKGLAQSVIAARVNGDVWDLGRPLESDCNLELLKWNDPESKEVYWHSSAHILGEAMERVYQIPLLAKGPPNKEEGGFYYEAFMGKTTVNDDDYKKLEQTIQKILKEKQSFERIEVSKEDAIEMFKYNKFKQEMLIDKVPEGAYCSVYRCGDLIDPCKGPHVLDTGRVKAFKVVKNSSSYWRADANKESLQRIYGISFPDKKELKEYVQRMEELKAIHHKTIGKKQQLWFSHEHAPGMFFFLPKGQHIFNQLLKLMEDEQKRRGFVEVQTPNMFHNELWKTSGHWYKYKDDMFQLNIDNQIHCLKPMNCPGHCLVFKHLKRSYRELPVRFSERGILHRNELKGALGGMTRLRRFQQDDAHIFCRSDQIEDEMDGCLKFMKHIYGLFGFEFKLFLSTRPETYIGDIEVWNNAEEMLQKSLENFGSEWEKDVGGGAFYGPKIDITIRDSLGRSHQCATIQLDFNLPERFELDYADEEQTMQRPVIIHRAVYGSYERFMAILTEHIKGKWPFWLSPRQVCILPVVPKFNEYAEKVAEQLSAAGVICEVDGSKNRIQKKVLNAQKEQWNFLLVVGAAEEESNTANVRIRDCDNPLGEFPVSRLIEMFQYLQNKYAMKHGLPDDLLSEEEKKQQEQAFEAGHTASAEEASAGKKQGGGKKGGKKQGGGKKGGKKQQKKTDEQPAPEQ
uniref:Probable threonine--tRNA ligase, cytoplasmic n=1 Tax=Percolomonas cosmopolitus TaxID=63605 RepID=A0A7S1KPI9_9EUKA|eukprot:CAMPEP_0117448282 /NCGR_PEP_ID=MMETSP0759-20121206/7319_1 /TAXON_ID=63605 /ORGANISM="Percolomonas cosmopolitus, Strain WS" /LENGTH=764 /DNA_ID=CAMNT_0005240661 /DNA_START=31 /DNA_END=2325 /DNA_ORIENTATION=+